MYIPIHLPIYPAPKHVQIPYIGEKAVEKQGQTVCLRVTS